MNRKSLLVALLLFIVLPACSPRPAASVSIVSHSEGQTLAGNPAITITASLTDAEGNATVTAEFNGTPLTPVRTDDTLSIDVTVLEGSNTVSFSVMNTGQVTPGTDTVTLHYAPDAPAGINFTSHSDGDVVIGARDVTFVAELTGHQPDDTITAELNGLEVGHELHGDVIEVPVTLADHANTLSISISRPYQAMSVETIDVSYPFVTLSTGQAATVVIGQADFEAEDETDNSKRFASPYGRALIAEGALYLPDYNLDRVLGYLEVPTANDAAADFVLGKADFDDTASDTSASLFDGAQTLGTAGERLFITDYNNHRVVIYDDIPAVTGAAADWVVGQSGLDERSSGCSATSLFHPESLTVVNNMLLVADSSNSRVLIWNEAPVSSGAPADLVLGQPDMTSCGRNNDPAEAGATARTLSYPTDVWSDGSRIVVVDNENSRVLIWNEFPAEDGQAADVVLGQSDFSSTSADVGASLLDNPYSVHSNGNQLFVADSDNNRILVWNAFPVENGQAADTVLGQTGMSERDYGLGSVSLDYPTGVYVHGNQVLVTDNGNERYLIFEGENP